MAKKKGRITKNELSSSLLEEIMSGVSGGSVSISVKKFSQIITNDTAEVSIGSEYFSKETDELLVFKNSVYLEKNEDYKINENRSISPMDGSQWRASLEEPSVFNFICLMNVPEEKMLDGIKIIDSTITESKLNEELKEKINKIPDGGGVVSGNASDIVITDQEGNFESDNVNDALKELATKVKANTTNIGTLSGLSTSAKDNLVNAVNEVSGKVGTNTTNIGTLSGLSTSAKDNLVNAVNEVVATVSSLQDELGASKASIQSSISSIREVL